jgi:hypothetical protein
MSLYEWKQFNNIGFITVKLSDEQLKPIKDEIKKIQTNPSLYTRANDELVGNIEHEYNLKESNKYVENLILPYINEYEKQFKYLEDIHVLNKNLPLGFDKPAWVNFMRKHEFNPIHKHSGIFSFVIWIDIPYSIEDEMKQDYCKSSKIPVPGHFEFLYTNTMGEIASYYIPADKTYNNTLIIFPANLKHGVYPFATSDGVRISVSGNYKLIV